MSAPPDAGPPPPPPPSPPPLPPARWGPPRPALALPATRHLELATRAEAELRRLLVRDNYDSVSNLLALYEAHERAGSEPLRALYARYSPPIRPRRHTCVGLAFELMRRWRALETEFPGLAAATILVSCEEAVTDVRDYVRGGVPEAVSAAEKEHVMVGVRVSLDGRAGLLLADPGYHVPRLVTVMQDRAYPHTGTYRTAAFLLL